MHFVYFLFVCSYFILSWTCASAVSGMSIRPRATPGTPAVLRRWHECPECVRKHCPACVCSLQPGEAHLNSYFGVFMCCCIALRMVLLLLYLGTYELIVMFTWCWCCHTNCMCKHVCTGPVKEGCPLPADVLHSTIIMGRKCTWKSGRGHHKGQISGISSKTCCDFQTKKTMKIEVTVVLFI